MSSLVRTDASRSVHQKLKSLFARTIKLSAITLCRTSANRFTGFAKQFASLRFFFSATKTLFSLAIQLASDRCRSSFIGQRENADLPFRTAVINLQHITAAHIACRFAAIAVDFHPAALNRFRGQRARLKKTCRPKPFINAY